MRVARRSVHWRACALLGLTLLGCSVKPVDLMGKSCPCAPDYVCDTDTGRCVKSLEQTGGAGGKDDGGGGTERDSGAGGTGGDDGGGGTGGNGFIDAGTPFDASALDARVGFDGATTFDAGDMCPAVPGGATCPTVCDRCEGTTCIFDCNYPYACGLVLPPCPAGWGCTAICSGPGACAAPFRLKCADGPCLLLCEPSTCLGGGMTCGSGPCEARCAPGSAAPNTECGSACSCTPCP